MMEGSDDEGTGASSFEQTSANREYHIIQYSLLNAGHCSIQFTSEASVMPIHRICSHLILIFVLYGNLATNLSSLFPTHWIIHSEWTIPTQSSQLKPHQISQTRLSILARQIDNSRGPQMDWIHRRPGTLLFTRLFTPRLFHCRLRPGNFPPQQLYCLSQPPRRTIAGRWRSILAHERQTRIPTLCPTIARIQILARLYAGVSHVYRYDLLFRLWCARLLAYFTTLLFCPLLHDHVSQATIGVLLCGRTRHFVLTLLTLLSLFVSSSGNDKSCTCTNINMCQFPLGKPNIKMQGKRKECTEEECPKPTRKFTLLPNCS